MRLITKFVAVLCLLAVRASAATIVADSTAYSDVTNAFASCVDGDTLQIPAGTSTWNQKWTVDKAINIEGAGTNSTFLNSSMSTENPLVSLDLVADKTTRLSGIQFGNAGASQIFNNGAVNVNGANTDSRRFVIRDCVFTNINGVSIFYRDAIGVTAACAFYMSSSRIPLYVYHAGWDGGTLGDRSWSATVDNGSEEWLFVEDCYFNHTFAGANYACHDGYRGTRTVFRFNYVTGSYFEVHGTESGGRWRGARSVEIYGNTFVPKVANSWLCELRSGGSCLIFSNTVSAGTTSIIRLSCYRTFQDFATWDGANGTNGWDINLVGGPFESGTATGGGTLTMTDTSKAWTNDEWIGYSVIHGSASNPNFSIITDNTADTITFSSAGGFTSDLSFSAGNTYSFWKVTEAIDQPGRGQGTELSGDPPSIPGGWNDQVDEPIYEWNNVGPGASDIDCSPTVPTLIRSSEHFFNDTPKPGYTPYTYPHPLRGEEGGGGGEASGSGKGRGQQGTAGRFRMR